MVLIFTGNWRVLALNSLGKKIDRECLEKKGEKEHALTVNASLLAIDYCPGADEIR